MTAVTISTHVLDTSAGLPAAGIRVRLARRDGLTWTLVSDDITNSDGRVPTLVPARLAAGPGEYRLTFDVASYFAARGLDSFYPSIDVCFLIADAAQHYHVPLLLSPFGYSTYRGS